MRQLMRETTACMSVGAGHSSLLYSCPRAYTSETSGEGTNTPTSRESVDTPVRLSCRSSRMARVRATREACQSLGRNWAEERGVTVGRLVVVVLLLGVVLALVLVPLPLTVLWSWPWPWSTRTRATGMVMSSLLTTETGSGLNVVVANVVVVGKGTAATASGRTAGLGLGPSGGGGGPTPPRRPRRLVCAPTVSNGLSVAAIFKQTRRPSCIVFGVCILVGWLGLPGHVCAGSAA